MKKTEFKIVDLFCGAGGFSKGFEMDDFRTVLALDKWDQAIETFNINHKSSCGLSIDINNYNNEMIYEFIKNNTIDGIIGGPPCQGYSMVGTRETSDARNSLYLQYVRFTEQIMPKFFILENVKGLLNLNKGFFKEDIQNRFSKLGYNVSFKVLKASEYGVPQNRERVFFVGLRKSIFGDLFFEFPEGDKEHFISTRDAISDLPDLDRNDDPLLYKTKPTNEYQRFMRKKSSIIYNNDITAHTEKTKYIISKVPDGESIKSISEDLYKVRNYNAAFKRMNSKFPSSTIDCGHRNYFHYSQNRIPTVRESARIQSFPDEFVFTGTKTSQYTQVGNAVPPLLGYAIAKKIREYLEMKEGNNNG